jgi:uncharacterized protein YegL
LILDLSASVAGSLCVRLNAGLVALSESLRAVRQAGAHAEVALVTFGDTEIATEFVPADEFAPPALVAGGISNPVRAIGRGLTCARANAAQDGRTLIFLVTNSALSGSLSALASRVEAGERNREFAFFAVGLDSADLRQLAMVAMRTPLRVKEENIDELFAWLSRTLTRIARTGPAQEVILEPPLWAR